MYGVAWLPEYGDADESPEMFKALLAYSPLQNVKPGVSYPAVLVTTADDDDRVDHRGQGGDAGNAPTGPHDDRTADPDRRSAGRVGREAEHGVLELVELTVEVERPAPSTPAGIEGWLLAETYIRAQPMPGFVLGFSGHPIPQLIASAEKLAKASLTALRANRKRDNGGTGKANTSKSTSSSPRSVG